MNDEIKLVTKCILVWGLIISSDERTDLFKSSTHCCLEMYSWSESKSVQSCLMVFALVDFCRLSATGLSSDRSDSSNEHRISFSSWLCLCHPRSNSVSRSFRSRRMSETRHCLVSSLKLRVVLSNRKNHVHLKGKFVFISICRKFLSSISRIGS